MGNLVLIAKLCIWNGLMVIPIVGTDIWFAADHGHSFGGSHIQLITK